MVTNASPTVTAPTPDEALVQRLLDGDEAAFADLVRRWSPGMLRLARGFVSTTQSAEDVVQDAWLAVLAGLGRFEGRASLRTWTFTILVNRAKSRGVREARTLVTLGAGNDDDEDGPTVDPDRFQGPDGPYPGHWRTGGAPGPWQQPESRVVARETLALIERALEELPVRQRTVVTMRDAQGFTADEVCSILGISPGNQRILLHRGRTALRAVLEHYYHD